MGFKRRLNSVYYKLIKSYVVLVILTTALAGFVSIAYFSHSYRGEVEKVNTKLLSNLAKTIDDNIIMQAEGICIDLSIEQLKNRDLIFFFDNPIAGNRSRITSVYNYLKDVVSNNADMIKSMNVYYLENDLIISSKMGALFSNQDNTGDKVEMSWLEEVDSAEEHLRWIEVAPKGSSIKYNLIDPGNIAVVFSYPITYVKSSGSTKGYIILELNRSILDNTIFQSTPKELGEVFIVNREGQIVSGRPSSDTLEFLIANRDTFFNDPNESVVGNIGGQKFIVSYMGLRNSQWCLVDITSTEEFSSKIRDIITPLIYICLGAIVLGLLVSNRFTAKIYSPLKSITDSTAKLFMGNSESIFQDKNEYDMINTVIDELSSKVTHLETTLNKNMPFINYHLISGLLNNKIKSRRELEERLRLSHIVVDKPHLCVFLIEIGKRQVEKLTIENSQYIKYSLIDFINNFNSNAMHVYTIELSDHTIASVVNFEDSINTVKKPAEEAIDYIYSDFMVEAVASIGVVVDDLMDIHKSYKAAECAMKYSYYIVDEKILFAEELLHRENSSSEIGEELLDEYRRGLNLNDRQVVKDALLAIAKEMKHGDHSWEHCQQTMSRLIFIYCNYVKTLNYKRSDILKRDIYEWFNDIENIVEFNDWLLKIIDITFHYIDEQAANKNSEVIESVKQYIEDNLGGDLSLITAAEHVQLTPNYLSKIFKDYTGETFIDYVMERRLSRAENLILTTTKTMEEIANEVGYSSASYLIRKFREAYGVTPNQYRYDKTIVR